ncbi:hypothetical protein PsorP6_016449 [Peronosclerospora sorghi]|uniref:Uncharacterized protein n=1 Tax=Peronosclerospora sorghi TaxID=230839 RepID=A0ACC0VP26_9STRA|nr:hypothetical protein PsorP6_016449 [Peronosclerospora sorghi]
MSYLNTFTYFITTHKRASPILFLRFEHSSLPIEPTRRPSCPDPLVSSHSIPLRTMSDEDGNARGFEIVPPPPPPPHPSPSPQASLPPPANRPKYTGKARIIRSSVFASRDAGKPKVQVKKGRKNGHSLVPSHESAHSRMPKDPKHGPNDGVHARPAHMLSVVELCNNSDEEVASSATTGDVACDTPLPSGDDDDDDDHGHARGHDGWSDHNRWYCNICKDGGELLCCDRCPRMSDAMLPDREWYCKMCAYVRTRARALSLSNMTLLLMCIFLSLPPSECLDRRRVKQEVKAKARVMRETEKLEREARRRHAERLKEDLIVQKSVEAIELKAKRVLEMQDRILSRKKIKYKDKEEEKLGKLAETLAQTVRTAKDKLDKLEKEDAALRRKEDAFKKKTRGLQDVPGDGVDDAARPEKPTPVACTFANIPAHCIGPLLAVWDCIYSFRALLELADVSIDQFSHALAASDHSTLVTEVHVCLLEKILADREEEEDVSDDEGAFDDRERCRYELQHAPLTVGVPTRSMLSSLTWPSILAHLIQAVPRYMATASPRLRAAVAALHTHAYPSLDIAYKLALVQFLVARFLATDKVRRVLAGHLTTALEGSKEYHRTVLLDRKVSLEDEKKLREHQRAELATLADHAAVRPRASSKSDDDPNLDAPSDHDNHDHHVEHTHETLQHDAHALETLQRAGALSRHDYVARRNQLDRRRARLRVRTDATTRQQKLEQVSSRKRVAANHALTASLTSKDAEQLRCAIERGRECGLPPRVLLSATHVLQLLDAEAARDHDAQMKRRQWTARLRAAFVRTEPLGRDRTQRRYWIFRGDATRVYVEVPSNEQAQGSGAWSSSTWWVYASKNEVDVLVQALDDRSPREMHLRAALLDALHDDWLDAMPVAKPGLLLSDLLNASSRPHVEMDVHAWRNDVHPERTGVDGGVVVPSLDALRRALVHGYDWIATCVRTLGSLWPDDARGGVAWRAKVATLASVAHARALLLELEKQVMAAPTKLLARSCKVDNVDEKVDDESGDVDDESGDEVDDEEDEVDEDDPLVRSRFWPSRACRKRWIECVTRAERVVDVATALAAFMHRLEVVGFLTPGEEAAAAAAGGRKPTTTTTRSKSERLKLKKERAKKPPPLSSPVVDAWDEACYVCHEGGQVLCCDGCRHVFHVACRGWRRVPRGKSFCHACPDERDNEGRRRKKSGRRASSIVDDDEPERPQRTDGVDPPPASDDPWDVDCSVCGVGGELLCCDGCPRAFHVACVGMAAIPASAWFCHECTHQTCGACGKNGIRLDAHVICGAEDGSRGCDRVFHLVRGEGRGMDEEVAVCGCGCIDAVFGVCFGGRNVPSWRSCPWKIGIVRRVCHGKRVSLKVIRGGRRR